MKTGRILVAGVGNIFLGDDAFGVEVVRRLATRSPADGVCVVDFGIRGIDLAYALQDPYERVILVDAVKLGKRPGTVMVVRPDTTAIQPAGMQTHEMVPLQVLASARAHGARLDHVLIVGCEPETFGSEDEPQMGLSATVLAAVPQAVSLVETLIAEAGEAAHA